MPFYQHSKLYSYLSDFDIAADGASVNYADPDPEAGGTEDAETSNGANRKYQALWQLRATLEEEEECSDTVRMEDLTSPEDSPGVWVCV